MAFSRSSVLAVTMTVGLAAPTPAGDPKPATLGTIERKDPAFDKLIPTDATIELLVPNAFEWAEGPAWAKDGGYLLFTDIPRNMIWKWSERDGLSEFLKPSGYTGTEPFTGREPGANGLTFDPDGHLILCQHGDRRVSRLRPDGKFETLADRYMGRRLNSPNDLAFHPNGDLYFTDPPYGLPGQMKDPAKELDFQGVYRLKPNGELTLLTKEMTRPNGIALSPDAKTLYVANSDPDLAIWKAFAVNNDGTLGEGRVFFDATALAKAGKPGLPDGLKVDRAGNLFATGPGGVLVFDPAGKHLGTLATGVPTANCAFGDDGSTLYITADKNLARVRTKTKGVGF